MMEDFKFYEVGGKIRDEFLGIKSKDVDYVAVPSKEVFDKIQPRESQPSPAMLVFDELKDYLEKQKFEIFLVTPRCYTIRAKFPEGHKYQGIADFVMARKEVGYIPGTRTPIIYPGTLYDDLSRRDFTVNALAKDPDTGEIVDYFNGMKDIWGSIIRTPLDPVKTFDDDPLRILRAIRFAITKRFTIADDAWRAMRKYDYFDKMSVVSEERIREELTKCFKYNTLGTLRYLSQLPELEEYIFKKTNLWLKPTNEK